MKSVDIAQPIGLVAKGERGKEGEGEEDGMNKRGKVLRHVAGERNKASRKYGTR